MDAALAAPAFDDFVSRFNALLNAPPATPDTAISGAKNLLSARLKQPDFRLDCIALLLHSLGGRPSGWRYPVIHRCNIRHYTICLLHWPSGFTSPAHRHATWTLTGILHGALTFTTFQEAPDHLKPDRQYFAGQSDVGVIATPCIHNVANSSATTALSVHIFSHPAPDNKTPPQAAPLHDQAGAIEAPIEGTIEEARAPLGPTRIERDAMLCACAAAIGSPDCARGIGLLEQIIRTAPPRAALLAMRCLAETHPARAATWANRIIPDLRQAAASAP